MEANMRTTMLVLTMCLLALGVRVSPAQAMYISGFVSYVSGDLYHLSVDYFVPYDGSFALPPNLYFVGPFGDPDASIPGIVEGQGSHLEGDFHGTGVLRASVFASQAYVYYTDPLNHGFFTVSGSANFWAPLNGETAPITQTPEPASWLLLLAGLGLGRRRLLNLMT